MKTHLCFYYLFLIHKLFTVEKLLHVACVHIYANTHTHTHTNIFDVEAVSCSEPRLGDNHDEQQEIHVKKARLLVAVSQN